MYYFTSDLHFGHLNICKFTERGNFTTPEDHDLWLIDKINSKVNRGDLLYILGDVSFHKDWNNTKDLLYKIKGQKIVIKGNHDREEDLKNLKLSGVIQNWLHYKEIKIQGNPTCLFHFPISSWHRQHYGSFHLHGHSHGQFKGQGKILDVGIDSAYDLFNEFKVFSEENVVEYMKSKELQIADLHRKEKHVE